MRFLANLARPGRAVVAAAVLVPVLLQAPVTPAAGVPGSAGAGRLADLVTEAARPEYRTTVADGREAVHSLLRRTDASSLSLAMVDRGRIAWRETFDSVDDAGTRPTVDTRYGLGSVSKTLTAVAVMQLVDGAGCPSTRRSCGTCPTS